MGGIKWQRAAEALLCVSWLAAVHLHGSPHVPGARKRADNARAHAHMHACTLVVSLTHLTLSASSVDSFGEDIPPSTLSTEPTAAVMTQTN